MVKIVHEDIKETRQFFNSKGTADDKQMLDQEESLINNCDKRITDFLISVSMRASIPPSDKEDIRIDLETVKNLERIGDLAMNLEEFYLMVNEDNGSFSASAMKDINSMYDYLYEMLDQAWKIHQSRDDSLFPALMVMEAKMDAQEVSARNAHFVRMEKGECTSAVAGSVFTDILATLERMGDHCVNIATSALSAANDPDKLKHNQETIQSSQDDARLN
jgi:phosphate:Na+ symporter